MNITFRELDENTFNNNSVNAAGSALDLWYNSIKDLPISELSIDDLCRACRQQIHLTHILPVIFDRIRVNPISGAQYDGELASVVSRIPKGFWKNSPTLLRDAKRLLESALPALDRDIQSEVGEFLREKNKT